MEENIQLKEEIRNDVVEAHRKVERMKIKFYKYFFSIFGTAIVITGLAIWFFDTSEKRVLGLIMIPPGLVIFSLSIIMPRLIKKYSTADKIEQMYKKYGEITKKT